MFETLNTLVEPHFNPLGFFMALIAFMVSLWVVLMHRDSKKYLATKIDTRMITLFGITMVFFLLASGLTGGLVHNELVPNIIVSGVLGTLPSLYVWLYYRDKGLLKK